MEQSNDEGEEIMLSSKQKKRMFRKMILTKEEKEELKEKDVEGGVEMIRKRVKWWTITISDNRTKDIKMEVLIPFWDCRKKHIDIEVRQGHPAEKYKDLG